MILDFTLILVLATLISGLIWLTDSLFFKKARVRRAATGVVADGAPVVLHEPLLVDYARSFFPILLVVLVVRSFIVEPFRIPSGSLMPTLLVGDFILVNKFSYGLRLPVLDTKILPTWEPKRGDIAVFRYPNDPKVDYIKRVIGVPGDHIRVEGNKLWVNGTPIPETYVGVYPGDDGMRMAGASVYRENLLGVEHDVLFEKDGYEKNGEWVVPPHEYFMMGDNRDNSNDSRYWGFVPEANLVGKAFMIWLHWDWKDGKFDASRIGMGIH
ncbi:signal peptidase I [Halothiobacillus sp.]|uniref:signal peptidase I n=1 Tax=Halothiobacillus sp. TaxID=1891311 RepID=UPI003D12CB98